VDLRQGRRITAYDPAASALWILTADDETHAAIFTRLTSATKESTDFALAVSVLGWLGGGVFPVEDGSLWLAYGLSLVRFDPATKAEQDVALPPKVFDVSAPLQAAVMLDGVIWVAQLGAHVLERYSAVQAEWLTPVPLPFDVLPYSQLLVAGSRIVIDGVAPTSVDGQMSLVTLTSDPTLVASKPVGHLASIASAQSGDLLEFGTDAALTVVAPDDHSTRLTLSIPVDELVASRPWISDESGQLWSWVRHFGDSLVRLDPTTGTWSYYTFPDVTLSSGDAFPHGSSDSPQNIVASPEIQTITATPDGIVVTTRAGENFPTQWAHASAYMFSP